MEEEREIERLRQEVRRLKELAYKDELTGLYNRRGFREYSEKFLAELIAAKNFPGQRESVSIKNFSLLVFDIDNFKGVNDTYGHEAGDKALKLVGRVIRENTRDIDLASRWGGEEIVVGLVGANEEDAFRVADRIREVVAQSELRFDGKKIKFTISGGIASFGQGENLEDIFRFADLALYQAKKRGKNLIVKYSDLSSARRGGRVV